MTADCHMRVGDATSTWTRPRASLWQRDRAGSAEDRANSVAGHFHVAAMARWSLVLAAVNLDISFSPVIHSHGESISELMVSMSPNFLLRPFAASAAVVLTGTPALAISCGSGSFQAWLDDFKTEAAAKGISQAAIASGLSGVTLDQGVLSR